MLWVGGDGHCAGSYAVNHFACCEDDFPLWVRGRQPHPDNAKVNWVTTIANTLKIKFINDADIKNTSANIIEKGKKFVLKNTKSKNIAIVGFINPHELVDLSLFFKEHNTRHIFFNTKDYIDFSIQNGFKLNNYGYFGKDAHQAWANVMISQLKKLKII